MAPKKRRLAPKPARRRAAAHPPVRSALGARPMSSFEYCRALIRDVPDFPKPGILFKDITPLLAEPARAAHRARRHRRAVHRRARRRHRRHRGARLHLRRRARRAPQRELRAGAQAGQAARVGRPREIVTEYSRDSLEMHKGSIRESAHVVVVDDVLATGGTAKAAAELVHKQGGYVVGFAFVVELVVPRRARAPAARARRELHHVLAGAILGPGGHPCFVSSGSPGSRL